MSCPICLDDFFNLEETDSRMTNIIHQLANCPHQFCRPCLEKWFLQCESNGPRDSLPTCPECRLEVNESDITTVAGEPAAAVEEE
jgi:hypothetical protein